MMSLLACADAYSIHSCCRLSALRKRGPLSNGTCLVDGYFSSASAPTTISRRLGCVCQFSLFDSFFLLHNAARERRWWIQFAIAAPGKRISMQKARTGRRTWWRRRALRRTDFGAGCCRSVRIRAVNRYGVCWTAPVLAYQRLGDVVPNTVVGSLPCRGDSLVWLRHLPSPALFWRAAHPLYFEQMALALRHASTGNLEKRHSPLSAPSCCCTAANSMCFTCRLPLPLPLPHLRYTAAPPCHRAMPYTTYLRRTHRATPADCAAAFSTGRLSWLLACAQKPHYLAAVISHRCDGRAHLSRGYALWLSLFAKEQYL